MTQKYLAQSQIARTLILNSVFGGQSHLIHLTIFGRFSLPSFNLYVHKGGLKSY